MSSPLELKIPAKLVELYNAAHRFIVLYGGRGGAKSWAVADYLLVRGYKKTERILCTREIQNSINQSVRKLLCDRINALGLAAFYEITDKTIRGKNGTEFFFRGLYGNPNSVKSFEGITIVWVEEAQSISRKSLDILIPTIRTENSQIIFTLNPTNTDDPVYVDYVLPDREDTLKIQINYSDNPFCPSVLLDEANYCRRVDYDRFLHVWQGQPVTHSAAQVFNGKWSVEEFETPNDTFIYAGSDWGFSNDPTVLIHSYIAGTKLYIPYEAYAVGCDLDNIPALFDTVPDSRKWPMVGDSSRPETISHINKFGFKVTRSRKGKNSIEDGISFIRSFEKVVIHPRCKHTIDEFRTYSYKVDPRTEIVSSVVEDKNNHCIDALRYALENVRHKARVISHYQSATAIASIDSQRRFATVSY